MAKATVDLRIEGMTCQGCVRSVTKKLASVAGVEQARVNLENAKATVDYDDAIADPARLVAAVEQIGFHAARE
jgi:copper chaperone